MKLCLGVGLLGVVLGCSSPQDESRIGKLEFYSWFADHRARYAEALDGGQEAANTQAILAQTLKVQIDKRYDSIVERAASETDAEKRELAVSALGFSQRPEAVVHLESHLTDPTPEVRGTAVAAIGILKPDRAPMEKIEALLSDPTRYCRQAALFAIKLLASNQRKPSADAMKRIHQLAVEDSEFQVRNEAVLALGRIRDKESVATLRRCLTDERFLIRGNAAQVLGGFGADAQAAVGDLIERLRDGETGVVQRAHYALKLITGRGDADPQYASWADWYKDISKVLEYYCPNDGTVNNVGGPCPKCGRLMDPRALPEAEYECPDHPGETSRKPGTCSKCKKDLVPRKKDVPK